MNDPTNVDRLLALLADETKPELSPYFEARLRRKLAEPLPKPEYARVVRYGSVVFMLFCAVLLASYDFLRWLIPLMIFLCMPEDWGEAVARRLRLR
jgi:hypothetical protein